MPNYDTYKIYFTKNLSKNQEKKSRKKVGNLQTSHLHSFLINKEQILKIKYSKLNFESFSPDS